MRVTEISCKLIDNILEKGAVYRTASEKLLPVAGSAAVLWRSASGELVQLLAFVFIL